MIKTMKLIRFENLRYIHSFIVAADMYEISEAHYRSTVLLRAESKLTVLNGFK